MKLALSGAQSVGKSTLMNRLKEEYAFQFIDEITRKLAAEGYNINEHGNDDTQIKIMEKHLEYSKLVGDIIYDRCSLDGVVYTHYLHHHGQVSKDTLIEAIRIFNKTINTYDYICYIKPEFDIVNDGQRSVDVVFRDEILVLFNYYIKQYNIKHVLITGSVEERVNQIKEILNDNSSK